MSFCNHLVHIGRLNENDIPEIVDSNGSSWSIDDSNLETREVYEVFYRWCAKNHRKPEFHNKNIQKVIRPNLNGKVIYTMLVIHATEVCNCSKKMIFYLINLYLIRLELKMLSMLDMAIQRIKKMLN
jgi:hypothetical protein